jgi:uncharacterized protein (DUF488 family)
MEEAKFFTIGYEGRSIDEFILCLKQHNITRIIDVRELPISRKKGFSKSSLKQRLVRENIDYLHLKALGSPTEMRRKLKIDKDFDFFSNAFSAYLSQKIDAIDELYSYLKEGGNCLMCFERDPQKCHRSLVAKKVNEYNGTSFRIFNI